MFPNSSRGTLPPEILVICDGQRDCEDGYDESDCGDPSAEAQEATIRFRLSRFNRYSDFYDIGDGEWGWFDANIIADVRSCFSWKCTNESDVSGMAMLVVDIPSGYIMLQVGKRKVYDWSG
jgi:hypothetical protein